MIEEFGWYISTGMFVTGMFVFIQWFFVCGYIVHICTNTDDTIKNYRLFGMKTWLYEDCWLTNCISSRLGMNALVIPVVSLWLVFLWLPILVVAIPAYIIRRARAKVLSQMRSV